MPHLGYRKGRRFPPWGKWFWVGVVLLAGCGGGDRFPSEGNMVRIEDLAWRDLAVFVTDTTATLSWRTREPKTSQVFYGTDPENLDRQTGLDPRLVTQHRVEVRGLTPHTTYYAIAVAADADGRREVRTPVRSLVTHNGAISLIAFVSDRAGGQQIFTMGADGSNPTPLTTQGGTQPRWSNDGQRLVFQGFHSVGGTVFSDLFMVNRDGTHLLNLTRTSLAPGLQDAWHPSLWVAPEGSMKLVYAAATFRSQEAEIYRLDLDAEGQPLGPPVPLTQNEVLDDAPVWSPDGTRIAFLSNERTARIELEHGGVRVDTLQVQDSEDRRVSPEQYVVLPGTNELDFTASTNLFGRIVQIEYEYQDPSSGEVKAARIQRTVPYPNWEVFVMNADGSGRINLINDDPHRPAAEASPTWSPDGTRIAFVSDREGNLEINTMNDNGSGRDNLTRHPADDYDPSWSPQGNEIAFVSTRDRLVEIYAIHLDSRKIRNITQFTSGDVQPTWGP